MKKKEVLDWPPCLPPDFRIRKGDGYARYDYLAVSQIIMSEGEDVLEIDIYHGTEGLMLRYFADEYHKKHKVLILGPGSRKGLWTGLALRNAISVAAGGRPNEKWTVYETSSMYWGEYKYRYRFETREDEARAREYLGEDIDVWETDIEHGKYIRQENRRLQKIDDMMEKKIPQLPDDFTNWIAKSLFDREYLFQEEKPKTAKYTCTACGQSFIRKKALDRRGICPKCGAKVKTIKTISKEIASSWETVYLLQETLDQAEWVERKFSVRRVWNNKGSDIRWMEDIRILIPKRSNWGSCYYLYRNDQGEPKYGDSNTGSYRCGKGLLYPGNLQQMMEDCWSNEMKHMGVDILAGLGEAFNVNNAVISGKDEKALLEYLIKGRFTKLACERINYSSRSVPSLLNREGKTDIEVLRLDPARIGRLRNMNGGHIALGWLQYEKATGGKLSQKNLEWLEEHGVSKGDPGVWKCLSYIRKPEVFTNYVKKQCRLMGKGPNGVISEWLDYLDMANKQKLNLNDALFYKPKNLAAAHDACVRNGQREELENRRKKILTKFPDVEKVMDGIREKYELRGEKFSILVPKDITDIILEGRSLGHCIDTTDRYFDRIQTKVSFLVFLRKTEALEAPWYTLEIEPGGTIRQQRTTGNKQNQSEVKAYTPFIRL